MTEQPETKEATPPLGSRLKDPADAVRLGALAEVYLAGSETLPDRELLATFLEDPSHEVRRMAVEVLALGGADTVDSVARGLLEHQPTPIRIASAMALGRLGPDAAQAIEGLRRCLDSPEDALRWHAGFALGKIGREAVPALCEALGSPEPGTASAAAGALAQIGAEGEEAAGALEQTALSTPEPMVRLACLAALMKTAEDPAARLPAMLQVLAEGDEGTREACLERLGLLGEVARDSVSAVLACTEDSSSKVRGAAALTVARIGANPDEAVPALVRLLSDEDPTVRVNSAIALSGFGPAAAPALPDLRRMAEEGDSRLCGTAKAAIDRIETEETGPEGDSPSGNT
ncbi:MAG: HEAT repeat domain-containing protein [Syntrophobacteraceae bacterium]|nr:HEAT repeat domain-containing protein [Syntrophobacteraceae bacterium]